MSRKRETGFELRKGNKHCRKGDYMSCLAVYSKKVFK